MRREPGAFPRGVRRSVTAERTTKRDGGRAEEEPEEPPTSPREEGRSRLGGGGVTAAIRALNICSEMLQTGLQTVL